MRIMRKLCILFICSVFLISGCGDAHRIQDMYFIQTLGADFKNGKYIAYAQIINFSTLAGGETGNQSQEKNNVWVGEGSGSTLDKALEQIRTTTGKLSSGHLSAVILGPEILNHNWQSVFDQLARTRNTRLTPWVFATGEPLDKVLTITPIYLQSAYYSIYIHPNESYKQDSFISPIRAHSFLSQINEPDNLVLIPQLTIKEEQWKNEKEPLPQLKVDGAYLIRKTKAVKQFSNEQLLGLRWVSSRNGNVDLNFKDSDGSISTDKISQPSHHLITTFDKNRKPHYQLNITVKAEVFELDHSKPDVEIKSMIAKKIKDQIISTYLIGIKDNLDLLQLKHETYQNEPKIWRKITTIPLTKEALTVSVDVNLMNSGLLKNRGLGE